MHAEIQPGKNKNALTRVQMQCKHKDVFYMMSAQFIKFEFLFLVHLKFQ